MKNKTPQLEDGYIRISTEVWENLGRYRLSGEEWLVLNCIIRKTYGWHKKEDRISFGQFSIYTGLKRPTVARTIKKLLSKKIIGVIKNDNTKGNLYCFNKLYNQWVAVIKKDNTLKSVIKNDNRGVIKNDNKVLSKMITTIDNTKDTNTKDIMQDEKHLAKINPVNEILSLFKINNPSYERLFANKTQRGSVERLLKKYGDEKVQRMVSVAVAYYGKPYAPQITTPYQLEQNLGKLIAFWKQEQTKGQKLQVTEIHI